MLSSTTIVEFIHNRQVTEVMANDVVFCDTEAILKILKKDKKVKSLPLSAWVF